MQSAFYGDPAAHQWNQGQNLKAQLKTMALTLKAKAKAKPFKHTPRAEIIRYYIEKLRTVYLKLYKPKL